MERVDAHVHVFAEQSPAFPREASDLALRSRSATAERLLREMDSAGVERAILIQMGGTDIEHHRYLSCCLERWPHRFRGVGLLNVQDPSAAVSIPALVDATGIEGIRLMGILGDPADEHAKDLAAHSLVEHAAALHLQVNLYTQSSQVPCIELLVRAFPQVTFSLDHLGICPSTAPVVDAWGRPRFDREPIPPTNYAKIIELAQYPNVYVKISGEYAFSKRAFPYPDIRPMVEQVYHAYGPERMMWCSDFPWICEQPGYQKLSTAVAHHLPTISEAERAMIMGGTALRVWFSG